MKKNLYNNSTFLPKTGGSQIGIFNIAKKLADFKRNISIFILPYRLC